VSEERETEREREKEREGFPRTCLILSIGVSALFKGWTRVWSESFIRVS